jgi:NAD(P)-dependent dehydrogenase (short-subunit alcohol dehydrogenase family)
LLTKTPETKQVSTISLLTTANWALPQQVKLAQRDSSRKPCLLVTSGSLYKDPFAPYFALSLCKAAQHNLTMSLNQAYAKQGVHVAAVVVHGMVRPESEYFSPRRIGEAFWALYEQGLREGRRKYG